MHVFPAIRGYTENDEINEGVSNNVRTCDDMIHNNHPIYMDNFAEKNWSVSPFYGIYSKEQAAFSAWAIARYQENFMVYYNTIKKFFDEDMLKP